MRLSLTRSSVCKCSAPHSQSVLMLNQDVIAHAAKSAFEFNVAMCSGQLIPDTTLSFFSA